MLTNARGKLIVNKQTLHIGVATLCCAVGLWLLMHFTHHGAPVHKPLHTHLKGAPVHKLLHTHLKGEPVHKLLHTHLKGVRMATADDAGMGYKPGKTGTMLHSGSKLGSAPGSGSTTGGEGSAREGQGLPIVLKSVPYKPTSPRPAISEERFTELHARPAQALRTGEYPHLQWPRYTEEPLPLPTDERLATTSPNPYVVLQYKGSFWGQTWTPRALPCPVPCILTSKKLATRDSDVLFFHGPGSGAMVKEAGSDTLLAMHSMESDGIYTHQKAGSLSVDNMDIQLTTKMHPVKKGVIHIPCPYANNHEYSNYTKVRPSMLNKTGMALFMHNNCGAKSKRQAVVQELMKVGLPVHAPGSCLHNYDPPGATQKSDPASLVSGYMFYLSMENVFNDPDWVSSTFFRNLDAGAVPVYLGAPNILKYAPGERSIIRACDFDSAEDLVDYLLALAERPEAYREYLEWKLDTGPNPEFKTMVSLHDTNVWCSTCMHTAAKLGYKYDEGITEKMENHFKLAKQFATLNDRLDEERTVPCRGKMEWLKAIAHGFE